MARSKRQLEVPLTKVARKGREGHSKLINQIREAVEKYQRIFVVDFGNDNSTHIQEVRQKLKPGRLFLGKNRVMRVALGNDAQSEAADGLSGISELLTGTRGLLFTNSNSNEVEKVIEESEYLGFAKHGYIATETLILKEGAQSLEIFPHSMADELRRLGLPVVFNDGKLHLGGDVTVCTKGKKLTSEAAQLLKLLQIRMAKFQLKLVAVWDNKVVKLY